MLGIIFMIVGAYIFLFLGLNNIRKLILLPLTKANNSNNGKLDELIHFTLKEEKATMKWHGGIYLMYGLIGIVVGGALFWGGFLLKFGPQGYDSLFSKSVEGSLEGDSENYYDIQTGDGNNTQMYISESDNGNMGTNCLYVFIEDKNITVKNNTFDSIEDFSNYFSTIETFGCDVVIVDCFASSKTYHDVIEYFNFIGIAFEEKME